MIKTNSNSRGFTLMELLVVIVILALLIIMAGPAVLRLMESGQQDVFRSDVKRMITIAETAFTDKSMRNDSDIVSTGTSKYMCVTLDDLIADGYLQKEVVEKDSTGKITNRLWKGWIEVSVPTSGTEPATYTVTITNGTYFLNKVTSSQIDTTSLTNASYDSMDDLTKPATGCPDIPTT